MRNVLHGLFSALGRFVSLAVVLFIFYLALEGAKWLTQ